MLTITVLLNDTSDDPSFIAKQGLSLLLETDAAKILFDTGPDASYLVNAQTMGIDVSTVSHVVISHGHHDHLGGLAHFPGTPCVIGHPDIVLERYAGFNVCGTSLKLKCLNQPLDLHAAGSAFMLTRQPVWIDESLLFLGEIATEQRRTYGLVKKNGYEKDALYDDSALVWKGKNGLVVIVGCAHTGICHILDYAKQVTGVETIAAVIGGLHLRRVAPLTAVSIRRYFKQQGIPLVYAGHCTGAWGRLWLPHAQDLRTGQILRIA